MHALAARFAGVLLVGLAWLGTLGGGPVGSARADQVVLPSCTTKRPGDLCEMPDKSGGVCTQAACLDKPNAACLECTAGPVNSPDSGTPVGFIYAGAAITLVFAVIVVVKLRRHWGDQD